MQQWSVPARQVLRWSAFSALPGVLLAAYEMYYLTMSGEQMLFFRIAHTMPLLVIAVWLAVPMVALWLLQSLVAVVWPTYRRLVSLPITAAVTFLLSLSLQVALLANYHDWSSSQSLRVPVCVLGMVATALLLWQSWRSLKSLDPGGTYLYGQGNR